MVRALRTSGCSRASAAATAPRVRVALGVTGRLERVHRDLVAHDVVRVRVAAVLVVRRHDVRPERPQDRTSGSAATSTSIRPKHPSGRGGSGSPSGRPSRPSPASPAGRRGSRGPRPSHRRRTSVRLASTLVVLELRVEDRTALATGAGDHVDVHALGDVAAIVAAPLLDSSSGGHGPPSVAGRSAGSGRRHEDNQRRLPDEIPPRCACAPSRESRGRPAGRYGEKGPPALRSSRLVVLAAAFVGWVVWAALGAADPPSPHGGEVSGFRVVSDERIDVRVRLRGSDRRSAAPCRRWTGPEGVVGVAGVELGRPRPERWVHGPDPRAGGHRHPAPLPARLTAPALRGRGRLDAPAGVHC